MDHEELIDHYQFLIGFIAHEVKNPVHIIGMYADLLLEESYGPLGERMREVIEAISFNANRLEHMAADFLNLSLIESGSVKIEMGELDLKSDLVKPVVMNLKHKFKDMGISFPSTLDSIPEGVTLKGNRNLLVVVFDNLIFNALKYGRREGKIEIAVQQEKAAVTVGIKNEGQGVPPDKIPLLFQKFRRLVDEDHQNVKGTGLGLYNVKRIIELHGGTIEAESNYGQDFTVRFTLPGDDSGEGIFPRS